MLHDSAALDTFRIFSRSTVITIPVILLFLAVFYCVAPAPLKSFTKWMIILWIGSFVLLRVLALIFGGGRGGRNAGMFESEGMLLLYWAIVNGLLVLAGIVIGIFFKKKSA